MRTVASLSARCLAIRCVEVDAVGVKGARPGQPVMGVNIQIAAPIRKKIGHPGQLGAIFGQMGLQVQIGHACEEFAREAQLF